MSGVIWKWIVLADGARWKSMGSGFRGRSARLDRDDLITGVLLVVGVCVAIAVLKYLIDRNERRQGYNSPRALFRALCKAHGLDGASRRLLRQMADCQGLHHRSRLFLEPDRFDVGRVSPPLQARAEEVMALRDRLFGAAMLGERATEDGDDQGGEVNLRDSSVRRSDVVIAPVTTEVPQQPLELS
ncbi:MAG: hypothetical protein WDZ59_08105 [Pirellulales bacterium]